MSQPSLRLPLPCLVTAALLAPAQAAPQTADSAESARSVLAFEDGRFAAMVRADTAWLRAALAEDRWVGKLRPLDNRSQDVQFLLTDWCDRLGDVLTFRKGPGRTLERRFRTPAQPIHGGDAVDTGFETIDLNIFKRPDGSWVLVQENKDGAQTHYTKASDVSLTEARTDLPGPPARLWRCDATTVR